MSLNLEKETGIIIPEITVATVTVPKIEKNECPQCDGLGIESGLNKTCRRCKGNGILTAQKAPDLVPEESSDAPAMPTDAEDPGSVDDGVSAPGSEWDFPADEDTPYNMPTQEMDFDDGVEGEEAPAVTDPAMVRSEVISMIRGFFDKDVVETFDQVADMMGLAVEERKNVAYVGGTASISEMRQYIIGQLSQMDPGKIEQLFAFMSQL